MVEVEAEMEVRWMGGQEIGEDIFEPLRIEGAEGFKELCCQGLIKDIRVDTITEDGEETLEILVCFRLFPHGADFGFLFVILIVDL